MRKREGADAWSARWHITVVENAVGYASHILLGSGTGGTRHRNRGSYFSPKQK